jgi:hypothetical protein
LEARDGRDLTGSGPILLLLLEFSQTEFAGGLELNIPPG